MSEEDQETTSSPEQSACALTFRTLEVLDKRSALQLGTNFERRRDGLV